jgi:hypothetical protein
MQTCRDRKCSHCASAVTRDIRVSMIVVSARGSTQGATTVRPGGRCCAACGELEVGDDDDLVALPDPPPGDQLDAVGVATAGCLSSARAPAQLVQECSCVGVGRGPSSTTGIDGAPVPVPPVLPAVVLMTASSRIGRDPGPTLPGPRASNIRADLGPPSEVSEHQEE